jgi:exodeoxyribonuclease VII small subunit
MTEEPEPTFEDALTRVERIVADLERGEPALSAALAKYEDGVKLLRFCHDLLDRAERSVALLTGVDDRGDPTTAPFDASATAALEPDPTTLAPTDAATPALIRKPASRRKTTGPDPAAISDPPF